MKGLYAMFKKALSLVLILSMMVILVSCSGDEDDTFATDQWNGTYVWSDEETEEFKVVEIKGIDEDSISFSLRSARTTESFEADAKSDSGRYIVSNLGSKTVKITLSSNGEIVNIDDMWTDDISLRTENWTGKYQRILSGTVPDKFGNSTWNGKYVCEETGLEISAAGIKEGLVLITYKGVPDEQKLAELKEAEEAEELENAEDIDIVDYKFKCLEAEKGKAVYTRDERLIIFELTSKNTKIKVTDIYMNNTENKGISGIYKRKVIGAAK